MHPAAYHVCILLLLLLVNVATGSAQQTDITPADSGWVMIPIDSMHAPQERVADSTQSGLEPDSPGILGDAPMQATDTISSPETPASEELQADTLGNPLGEESSPISPPDSLITLDTIPSAPPNPLQRFVDSLTNVTAGYDSVLQENPYDLQTRLNRGRIRSWLHNHDSADADLRFVLEMDPTNIEAMNALGYNLAWSGRFNEAESMFRQSLETAPDQVDAAKGLGYTSLWRGNAPEAVKQFGALANHSPEDPEIQVALGQAQLQAGRTIQARNAFKRALTIDPARSDAREALQSTRLNPAAELTGWVGNTWSRNIGTGLASSRSGVRFAEVATSPVDNLRLWLQYDNGMTFDNVSFALRNRDVPAYYLGGYMNYEGNLTTRFEIGFRKMPGDDGQYLIRAEHVIGLEDGYSLKFGGWGTPFDDNTMELILHAAFGIPVGDQFRIEPTVIYSRPGAPGEFQIRTMFAGEYSPPNKWQIGGAAVAGFAAVGPESTITTLWDAYVRVTAPIGTYNRLHVLLRREAVRDFNAITVLSAGLTIVIGKP